MLSVCACRAHRRSLAPARRRQSHSPATSLVTTAPGSDQRRFANRHAGHDRRIAADRGPALYACRDYRPVSFSLQCAVVVDGARVEIVSKHHAMAHKDFVFNRHAFADKRVRRNFAARADRGVLLNLDKRSDLRFIADRAAIEIHQIGLKNSNVLSQRYIRRQSA